MNATDKFSVKVLWASQCANIITRCHTCPDAVPSKRIKNDAWSFAFHSPINYSKQSQFVWTLMKFALLHNMLAENKLNTISALNYLHHFKEEEEEKE